MHIQHRMVSPIIEITQDYSKEMKHAFVDPLSAASDTDVSNFNKNPRVKLYILNENRAWDDQGIAHVTATFVNKLKGISLVVRKEHECQNQFNKFYNILISTKNFTVILFCTGLLDILQSLYLTSNQVRWFN